MKIGLVRHFRVVRPFTTSRWMTAAEYRQWVREYDELAVTPQPVDLGPEPWPVCYASDLPRALTTARHIYSGPIRVTPLLREITLGPVFESRRRLPFVWHNLANWWAWQNDRPVAPEIRQQTRARIQAFLEQALAAYGPNLLIVSHGGLMRELRLELLRRGFTGDAYTRAENARLYVFERQGVEG